jgi:hypothetical protein
MKFGEINEIFGWGKKKETVKKENPNQKEISSLLQRIGYLDYDWHEFARSPHPSDYREKYIQYDTTRKELLNKLRPLSEFDYNRLIQ